MSGALFVVLVAILLCPLLARWGGKRTRWAISLALLTVGLFVSFFLFGMEARIAIKNSSLIGSDLNIFAQGVVAHASRIWVERLIVGAVIVALFLLAVLDQKKGGQSTD